MIPWDHRVIARFHRDTRAFRFLWYTYLGMWGPRQHRTLARVEHHWRLHQLMNSMEDIEDAWKGESAWDAFLDDLPGFNSYWDVSNQYNMDAHHAE